jgi:hypothetical protein
MVTKEQIKKEVDKIPDNLLDEAYTLLKKITFRTKRMTWKEWQNGLEKFTPDFMNTRDQPSGQMRDSFD